MEEDNKNSLLGQLHAKGILNENTPNGEYFPFGMLTGSQETSPFETHIEEKKPAQRIMKKRLNDFDYNIFQEGNFLNIDDLELDNSEKIQKIKSMIKKLDEKIYMLEDSDDEILLKKIKDNKEALLSSLALLLEDKEEQKDSIRSKIRKLEKIIFKICPLLHKSFLVRRALNKLVMLNENAKNICSKQIPYGEQEGRYNDFVAYLSCANVIHAKLTKKM